MRYPVLLGSFSVTFLIIGLPIYGKFLGASALAIGGLYSVFTVTVMALRPIVGWALDRFGRRWFLVGALAATAASMLLFALADSMADLYVARLAQGAATAAMWVSLLTIATDLSASNARGRTIGRVQEVSNRGGIYGAGLGFVLFWFFPAATAWQIAFWGYALLAAAGAWLAWRSVPESLPHHDPEPAEARRPFSGPLLTLMLIALTTEFSTEMLSPIYLIFLQDRFTTDIMTIILAGIPAGLVYCFLPSRLGQLSDRFGRAPLMALGLVVAGSLSLFLPLLHSMPAAITLFTLAAVGWAMAAPAEAALVADLAGTDRRGRTYGWYEFAGRLGATLGPLLGGWLYDTVGHAVPFFVDGVVLLATAVWVMLALGKPAVATSQT